jgi:alkanesulfonate monooxygenase SsuD/methylene tetrahydromethanopterin reductase-like flavin-dependent oxidoreductase (luciferase family)
LNSNLDAGTLCQQAELAEAWAYDSFFLPEGHFAGPHSIPDPIVLLAAVAARTSKIKLGTSSYLLPIRHPLLAAEQIAALDQLSGGRVILGLGRGFQAGMLEAFGVAQSDKRARFDEILQAMRAAWRGEYVGDPGRMLELTPRPLQQPHPPLWVAAFGPKAIAQAGSLGLPYLASPMETCQELERNHELHRNALRAAGHQVPAEIVVMRTVFVSENEQACHEIRARLADQALVRPTGNGIGNGNGNGDGDGNATVDDCCLVGHPEKVREDIVRYQRSLGMNHLIAVRPRVKGVAEDALRESLQALRGLRVSHPRQPP